MRKTRNITHIRVNRETKMRLRSLGLKSQTYDEIISCLLEKVEHEKFMEKQYQRLKKKTKFVPLSDKEIKRILSLPRDCGVVTSEEDIDKYLYGKN